MLLAKISTGFELNYPLEFRGNLVTLKLASKKFEVNS